MRNNYLATHKKAANQITETSYSLLSPTRLALKFS